MRRHFYTSLYFLCFLVLISACTTKKKKGEVGWLGKFYHNTTAKYNGYYNANVLLEESIASLDEQHIDNYNKVLDIYPYEAAENPQAVAPDLDKAIEKVTLVATLHEPSHWVDDCYVLMGKAQFLKQDYETAEETLRFFEESYDPFDPSSRVYNKEETKKNLEKERKQKREERQKIKEKEKEEKEAQNKREKELKEQKKLEKEKADKAERERKKREKELKKKQREEQAKKNRKKKRSKKNRGTKKRPPKEKKPEPEPEKIVEVAKEIETPVETTKPIVEEIKPEEKSLKEIELEAELERAEKLKNTKLPSNKGEGGGLFKHKSSYNEGLYWLVRTYIERANWSSAGFLIERLAEKPGLSKEIAKELPVVSAHLKLQQKKYEEAIPHLEQAINSKISRPSKARYAYILGQLYENSASHNLALVSYTKAEKLAKNYEMKFNAKLSLIRSSWVSGASSIETVLKQMDKLKGDRKNKEYLGQIYFTQAQLKLASGDVAGAMADFEEALSQEGGSELQKSESFYRLANLLYDLEDYVGAKSHYDSALKNMTAKNENYSIAKRRSDNLREIVKFTKTAERQDSLLRLSELPREDLYKWAEDIIKEQKANEEIVQIEEEQIANAKEVEKRFSRLGKSSFFAYNPIAVDKGKIDFNRKWGDLNLSDNWRRSASRENSLSRGNDIEEDEQIVSTSDNVSSAEIDALLREVPRNKNQKEASHNRYSEALYELGSLYRYKISNFKKSNTTLIQFLEKYPKNANRLDALYNIHLNYLDLDNRLEADKYKQLIIAEFPESEYGKVLSDPNYLQVLADKRNALDLHYQKTYTTFQEGNFDQALELIKEAEATFSLENELNAKYGLLEAMCIGSRDGKEAYIAALKDFIGKQRNTPEQTRASEIMRFLKGDTEAFVSGENSEELAKFELENDKLHYVILVVYDTGKKTMKDAKVKIANYNNKYNKLDRLRVSDIYLNTENKTQVVLIRKFKNKTQAMAYYNGLEKNNSDFLDAKEYTFDAMAVTSRNYREIMKQRTAKGYQVFFEEQYLKGK